MHALAAQLAPVIAAEKSKTAFYIVGGLLVAWALIVSIGLGMRRPEFPGGPGGQRVLIAITAVLVLGAASTAVLTSSSPAKTGQASTAAQQGTTGAPEPGAPASPAPASTSSEATTTSGTAPATTTSSAPSTSAPAGASTALSLAANPSGLLSYNAKRLSAKSGAVTITFANASPLEHNVTIAQGSNVLGATPTFVGGSKTLTLNLKPGTYTFYCSVPGHRAAGMEGTLNVS